LGKTVTWALTREWALARDTTVLGGIVNVVEFNYAVYMEISLDRSFANPAIYILSTL
jgi:hypothetical protein